MTCALKLIRESKGKEAIKKDQRNKGTSQQHTIQTPRTCAKRLIFTIVDDKEIRFERNLPNYSAENLI